MEFVTAPAENQADPSPRKPQRPYAERYAHAQAVRVCLWIDRVWRYIEASLAAETDYIVNTLQRTGALGAGRVPARRQLVLVCARRVLRNETAAAGSMNAAEVEIWPADLLAARAATEHRRKQTTATLIQLITAALSAWSRFRELDQAQADAARRMDELRKLKGAT